MLQDRYEGSSLSFSTSFHVLRIIYDIYMYILIYSFTSCLCVVVAVVVVVIFILFFFFFKAEIPDIWRNFKIPPRARILTPKYRTCPGKSGRMATQ